MDLRDTRETALWTRTSFVLFDDEQLLAFKHSEVLQASTSAATDTRFGIRRQCPEVRTWKRGHASANCLLQMGYGRGHSWRNPVTRRECLYRAFMYDASCSTM
jgi:hypothetical protein